MSLQAQSLLLYGFAISNDNKYIDFQSTAGTFTALLPLGYYSLGSLLLAVAEQMNAVDSSATYTATANRNIAGGTENRVTISSSDPLLSLLFGTGTHNAASPASLLGFNQIDYTGGVTYSGSTSAGTALIPVFTGYNWVSPQRRKKIFGAVNISAIGEKEAIVFQIQEFFKVDFKYEPVSRAELEWESFFEWAIQQRKLEFTPEITSPDTFYEATLESTSEDGKGLGFEMPLMLPAFPFLTQTGLLMFRKTVTQSQFIG